MYTTNRIIAKSIKNPFIVLILFTNSLHSFALIKIIEVMTNGVVILATTICLPVQKR